MARISRTSTILGTLVFSSEFRCLSVIIAISNIMDPQLWEVYKCAFLSYEDVDNISSSSIIIMDPRVLFLSYEDVDNISSSSIIIMDPRLS